jgi:hypothetical protein
MEIVHVTTDIERTTRETGLPFDLDTCVFADGFMVGRIKKGTVKGKASVLVAGKSTDGKTLLVQFTLASLYRAIGIIQAHDEEERRLRNS